jgi:hypothetical protein
MEMKINGKDFKAAIIQTFKFMCKNQVISTAGKTEGEIELVCVELNRA